MDIDEFEGSQGIWSEHLPEFTPADFGEDHWEYNDAGWNPDLGWESTFLMRLHNLVRTNRLTLTVN